MARYTYVMSDIHGQMDALMRMIEKIDFGYEDELYILGDVIDRGTKSVECIKWIMEQDNILTLMGNHELLLYDNYVNESPAIYNTIHEIKELSKQKQEELVRWIENMPECKMITVGGQKFYLNHTQIPSDEYFKQELTDRMFPEYSKYRKYYNLEMKGIICIHGHIPTMQMRQWNKQTQSNKIWKNKSGTIIDIDCGAGYPENGGCLGCLRLNDMKEFYIEL